MGVSALDNLLGGLVVGTFVNSLLIMTQFIQSYKYYRYYPKDPPILRVIVGFLIVLNIDCIIGNYANVYMFCVTHWGDKEFVSKQYWPTQNFIVSSSLTAIITQSFLIWRFWRLCKSYVVSIVLVLISCAGFGGALALTAVILANDALSQRASAKTTATIWFVGSASADICIAVALLWQFRRIDSFFDHTRSLMRRLIAATIRSGTVTSSVALTAFFLYLADNQANWATGVVFMIGPVYALTMLSNLNSRKRVHGQGHTDSVWEDGTGGSSGGIGAERRPRGENFALSGIHVVRTVQLNDDRGQPTKFDANIEAEADSIEDRSDGKRFPLKQSGGRAV